MVIKDISKISIPNHVWKKRKKINKIFPTVSLDTETVKGKCVLICDNHKRYLFPNHIDELINYLFYKNYQYSINFFYNLKYDTNAIIKLLPKEHIKNISNYKHTIYTDRNLNVFDINIIPDKLLKISKGHHTVKFFDLAQFYNKKKLQTLAEEINKSKVEIDDIGNLDVYKIKCDINYQNKILDRCYEDCIITDIFAQKLIKTINKFVKIRNYYSGASISRQLVLQNLNKKYLNLPSLKFMDYALKSYNAGRFEILKKGYFKSMIERDINSAYPYEIANLLSCDGLYKYNKEYEPESTHSFLNCDVKISECYLSPLRFQLPSSKKEQYGNFGTNLIIYPSGSFKNVYLTKTEYETILNSGFDITVNHACHLFNSEPEKPFEYIDKLYYYRKEIQKSDKDLSDTIKVGLNGIYGTFININKESGLTKIEDEYTEDFIIIDNEIYFTKNKTIAGNMFNPVWAAEICANVRCKIYNDFKKYEDRIICIATDGVKLTKDIPIKESNKLGEYDKSSFNEGILIGSGVYQFGDKTKFRGFDSKLNLKDLLLENKDKKIINTVVNRVLGLKPSVNNITVDLLDEHNNIIKKKLNIDDINLFVKINRSLNINFDHKRIWDRNFTDCNDILTSIIDSKPIHLS